MNWILKIMIIYKIYLLNFEFKLKFFCIVLFSKPSCKTIFAFYYILNCGGD